MKVFFLIDATFSERDFDRLGIEALMKNNFQVFLWDFSKLRNEKNDLTPFEVDLEINKVNRFIFQDFQELLEKIKEVEKSYLFDLRSSSYKVYDTCWFKSHGAILVKFDQGLVPLDGWRPSVKDFLIIFRNNILNNGFTSTISRVLRYTYNNFLNQRKECYDIRVCSGSISQCNDDEFEIRSHSYDYDIYLEEKNKNINTKKHIIFLDNGMTSHPDYEKLGIPPHCSEEVYYPLLRSFFTKVEDQIGLPVIVSLHPRLNIDDSITEQFGNREIISGKSAELVKNAELVIAHNSTAINFAILWSIPLIIVTTNQLERSIYYSMESLTQALKTSRININNPYENLDFLEIAQEPIPQYNHFEDRFIKVQNTPNLNSAEILIKGLQNYV
tara:strand:+ start:43 stop:1200 length:1158 start_codon:yes stop_codon:yes gene_type:complete